MPFWGWALIYVAGWMATFRIVFLSRRDRTQRWIAAGGQHRVTTENRYGSTVRLDPTEAIENRETKDALLSLLEATLWPLVLLGLGAWVTGKIGSFIMFPRGVKTKFDREQELKQKLAEETKALEAAKELLQREGINA